MNTDLTFATGRFPRGIRAHGTGLGRMLQKMKTDQLADLDRMANN